MSHSHANIKGEPEKEGGRRRRRRRRNIQSQIDAAKPLINECNNVA